jgi:hypothetical protein
MKSSVQNQSRFSIDGFSKTRCSIKNSRLSITNTHRKRSLSWKTIKNEFGGLWVELTEYMWNSQNLYPSSGIVSAVSPSRQQLISALKSQQPKEISLQKGRKENRVILYVCPYSFE